MLSFELRHSGNSLVISDFRFSQDDAKSGNPYNTTFTITVASDQFRGVGECEYDIKEFIEFAKQINELYEFQRSNVELQEICYGSYISFNIDKTGHLTISGEIFGRAMIHSLRFEFVADQTSLKPLVDSLKQVYKEQHI